MSRQLCAGAAAVAAALACHAAPAAAHAVCGERVFPATLDINDPGVGDECVDPDRRLPASGHQRPAGVRSRRVQLDQDHFFSEHRHRDHRRRDLAEVSPGGSGWDPLSTEAQWADFCWDEHELIATLSFNINWANTGTGSQTQSFNTYEPVIDIGKGFGDLPKSLNALRPLALTLELSETFPGQNWTNGNQNPTTLNGGFTIQYSLPYFNSQVGRDRQRLPQAPDPGHRTCVHSGRFRISRPDPT